MTGVLVVGVAVVDLVFQVDEMPRKSIKYRAREADIVGGGCAANAAVAISRLGGQAQLVSRLGQDFVGDQIVGDLLAEGVDCGFVRRFENNRSSFSSVYVDNSGERQIVNYRDSALPVNLDWIDSEDLNVGSVLADTRWPHGAKRAMEIARELGVPGILDAEDQPTDASEAMALATHVAFSSNGLKTWFEGEKSDYSISNALSEFNRTHDNWVCVTQGSAGCWCFEDQNLLQIPGFPVDAVDTLGAGDVWHGAFALELAKSKDERSAIRVAHAAAALKCGQFGGRRGSPTETELSQFLKENQ